MNTRNNLLVLDGAMGTMIQKLNLSETDFRGDIFTSPSLPALKGCNDILCLTAPDKIADIHRQYLEAGADIIETNTFNANALSLKEYGLAAEAQRISRAGAALARNAVDDFMKERGLENGERRLVAGSMGPTGVSLSIEMREENPRADFDSMARAYAAQAEALMEGGVDLLLLETIFDTLNAKAAIYGIEQTFEKLGRRVPLMISATVSEQGRLLSGQTIEAFLASIAHANPISVGLNCGFGAETMIPLIGRLAEISPFPVSMHPNAGLPDEMGHYHCEPEEMAALLRPLIESGKLSIVGGCCGTTPAHIARIAEIIKSGSLEATRKSPLHSDACLDEATWKSPLHTSGTEAYVFPAEGITKIGERCNVAGSRKFLRLVNEGKWSEAVDIAANQIEKGARLLDINMDAPLLNARKAMKQFVALLGGDMRTAPVPLMIDSSDFEVVRTALKLMQGKGIVNSISLKNGEEDFLAKAREIHRLGAAMVVMAFDEEGQADTYQRRVEICTRSYRLLTEKGGIPPHDIIFDPNILAIATGIESHDRYSLDFLDATEYIHNNLPGALVSGGVSNLSFSFRGNDAMRSAMHALFLGHAARRGMNMAIVNPATKLTGDHLDEELRTIIDDVLLCRRPDATVRLVEKAVEMKESADALKNTTLTSHSGNTPYPLSPNPHPAELLREAIVKGDDSQIENLTRKTLAGASSAMQVVNDVLMDGMDIVGKLFAEGSVFLPQVVRSASVMKKAVDILTPTIEKEQGEKNSTSSNRRRGVLATVKGDVHDIGKNIVAVVMRCSGFDIIDLGVMTPAEEIVRVAKETDADFIGLSGLITPSLHEMEEVARLMEHEGMRIPLFIGGATTSAIHTVVKIATQYSGEVVHTRDAAALPPIANRVLDPSTEAVFDWQLQYRPMESRSEYDMNSVEMSLGNARKLANPVADPAPAPNRIGEIVFSMTVREVMPFFNKRALLGEWKLDPAHPEEEEARRLLADAERLLKEADGKITAKAVVCKAASSGDDIILKHCDAEGKEVEITIPTLRTLQPNPKTGKTLAMSDFVARENDHIALFAVSVAGSGLPEKIEALKKSDEYFSLLLQSVTHRLVEAATEYMHRHMAKNVWGLPEQSGIRPAVGYHSLPDQSVVFLLDSILHYEEMGIEVTEHGALFPSATTTGLLIMHPAAHYFDVGRRSLEQFTDYAIRRQYSLGEMRKFLPL